MQTQIDTYEVENPRESSKLELLPSLKFLPEPPKMERARAENPKVLAILEACKEHPGQWVVLRAKCSRGFAATMRKRYPKYEFKIRTQDGAVNLWCSFVG